MLTHRTSASATRSCRVFNHVEFVTDVRPSDVLTFLAKDQSWRDGLVHSRACDVGILAAWWVITSDWQDNDVRRVCALVQRCASGCLAEVVDHDHPHPVIFLT